MTQEELKVFFSKKASEINRTTLHMLFNEGQPSYVPPNTKIILDEKILKEVDSEFCKFKNADSLYGKETTFGRFLANIVIYNIKDASVSNKGDPNSIEIYDYNTEVKQLIDYKNFTFDAKKIGAIYSELSELLIDGIITSQAVDQFIDNLHWLGFTLTPYMTPSLDIISVSPTAEIKAMRDKMFKENQDVFDNNDVMKYNNNIEPALISQAAKILDDAKSSGKIIFDSGFNGNFSTNYKITSLARGVVAKSDDPSSYSIATSSLVEGVSKKETVIAGDIAVQGSLGRAIDTRQGGYKTKQFYAGFQSVTADVADTDCGTTYTIKVQLTPSNYSEYTYRYIVENKKLVLLDRKNKDSYMGKTVDMRTPFFCHNPRICNKCAGEMLVKLGIKNIGLTSANIGSALLNASLKAFHTLAVKSNSYDISDFIQEIN
jgi:hypothetical protein